MKKQTALPNPFLPEVPVISQAAVEGIYFSSEYAERYQNPTAKYDDYEQIPVSDNPLRDSLWEELQKHGIPDDYHSYFPDDQDHAATFSPIHNTSLVYKSGLGWFVCLTVIIDSTSCSKALRDKLVAFDKEGNLPQIEAQIKAEKDNPPVGGVGTGVQVRFPIAFIEQ